MPATRHATSRYVTLRHTASHCCVSTRYCNYVTGVGGSCAAYGFDPPSGYWCANAPPRGQTYHTKFPQGLAVPAEAMGGRRWSKWRANETVVNAFRSGHWFR